MLDKVKTKVARIDFEVSATPHALSAYPIGNHSHRSASLDLTLFWRKSKIKIMMITYGRSPSEDSGCFRSDLSLSGEKQDAPQLVGAYASSISQFKNAADSGEEWLHFSRTRTERDNYYMLPLIVTSSCPSPGEVLPAGTSCARRASSTRAWLPYLAGRGDDVHNIN